MIVGDKAFDTPRPIKVSTAAATSQAASIAQGRLIESLARKITLHLNSG